MATKSGKHFMHINFFQNKFMTVDKIFIAISTKHILKSTKSHSHISKAYSHISKVPICNLLYGSTIKDFSVFLRF